MVLLYLRTLDFKYVNDNHIFDHMGKGPFSATKPIFKQCRYLQKAECISS